MGTVPFVGRSLSVVTPESFTGTVSQCTSLVDVVVETFTLPCKNESSFVTSRNKLIWRPNTFLLF